MKPPKRLFKRDRVSEDHESVTVSTADLLPIGGAFDPSRHVAQVPVARFVELDCDHCLRGLEALGVRVDRSKGSSAIDIARNIRATEAVVEGFDSILFIDSDMLFDPVDAITLLRSPEPVIAGAYAAKKLGNGQLNVDFLGDAESIRFGDWAPNPYPVRAVGAGFLRIKTAALKHVAKELNLPWCRMAERFAWPFFQPMITGGDDGGYYYLGEDYSFINRCRLAGLTPKVDTSFRLYHIGDYAYGLEEACGQYLQRSRNIDYRIKRSEPRSAAEAVPPSLD
jgi:hypothetical protein